MNKNKNASGSKIVITIWSIILFSIVGYFVINSRLINKILPGFYFEKYKTAEEAKETLLKLHPIGSDVDELLKTLKKAGGNISKIEKMYDSWIDEGVVGVYSADYFEINDSYIFFGCKWGISIFYDNNKKIYKLIVNAYPEVI
jgi:hypothetical protein